MLKCAIPEDSIVYYVHVDCFSINAIFKQLYNLHCYDTGLAVSIRLYTYINGQIGHCIGGNFNIHI